MKTKTLLILLLIAGLKAQAQEAAIVWESISGFQATNSNTISIITPYISAIENSIVTNIEYKYPSHSEPGPYPTNYGANGFNDAVYYSHQVPDENPTNRWKIKTLIRRSVVTIKFQDGSAKQITNDIDFDKSTISQSLEKIEKWNDIGEYKDGEIEFLGAGTGAIPTYCMSNFIHLSPEQLEAWKTNKP